MKKLFLATAAAATFLAAPAFAQSKNFEGLSLGLSANFNNGKTEVPGQSPSESNATIGLKAVYGWGFGANNFNLGASLSYDAGAVKMGTTTGGTSSEGKGLMLVSVEPGFKASNDMLVYAKLGYAMVKGELSGASTGSENYDGNTLGVGLRAMVNKWWSVDLEAQQVSFTAKRSATVGGDVKPSASVISIGASYHF